ncbi:MAG: helix-turn-helix domain-containing protein [Bradyrhizobium sp.]|nr:helix-turn-helix domain-containing protein [Bradyrhizobium sp.]
MDTFGFSTRSLDAKDQSKAWAEWFYPVFDVFPEGNASAGFAADYLVWNLGPLSLTCVSAPAARTIRTSAHIRRSPSDHWVVSYCRDGPTAVATNNSEWNATAGIPFLWSLGQASDSRRTASNRLQLYLPRDSFSEISGPLDMAAGSMIGAGPGQLLAEYMMLLERSLPNLSPDEAARLPNAVRSMVAACLAPSADRLAYALPQIKVTMLEKVRQAVSRNLRSPSLGPRKLCQETAMSRSQLYRVLESEGGVASYIQRRRLAESFSMLCDASHILPIAEIAANLCFSDASSFSRAFKREFGVTPSDVRISARSGLPAAKQRQKPDSQPSRMFSDCLRRFDW